MPSVSLAFFAIDHGTASTATSLIAPVDGRFRLLASAVAPRGVEVEAMLEDLVLRVTAIDPELLGPVEGWRRWARLESATRAPRRVLCVATSSRVGEALARMFAWRGWSVAGRIDASHIDPLGAMTMCLAPDIDAIAVAAGGRGDEEQRARARVTPLIAAVSSELPDLPVLVCGPGDWPELSGPTIVALAPPEADPALPDAALADILASVERHAEARRPSLVDPMAPAPPGDEVPDGRIALADAVATLAALLDRRVEAVDVGQSGGARMIAGPAGSERVLVTADAALVPTVVPHASTDRHGAVGLDAAVEDIADWSAIRTDPFTLADRLRNLRLAPWRDVTGDGARLRSAALRAALLRLDRAWHELGGVSVAGDLLVCCGGAFAAMPPAAAALAVVDGMRAPGVRNLFHDHARLLGPIGALPDEGDRRRLLADLLDDALVPLGSTIVVGEGRVTARAPVAMRFTSPVVRQDLELSGGTVQVLELPAGTPARVELASRDAGLLGLRSRRVAVEVTGGLGGLLVDTRDIPLRLPDRAERRRAQLEAWQRPVWQDEP